MKKNLHWIKIFQYIFINIFISIFLFEISSYVLFEKFVKNLEPRYKTGFSLSYGRGYPRYHFKNHPKRGFDISPGVETVSWTPVDAGPYKVWGNSFGCFDKERSFTKRPDIYLAGDSFTWGYAPYYKKFTTIIEKETSSTVMKCGVTHTGQRHQFSKFKEISQKIGYYPKTVIINVSGNDIANDFAFPHTTIIDGFMVEDTFLEKKGDQYRIFRENKKALEMKYYTNTTGLNLIMRNINEVLSNYSATYNLLKHAKRRILLIYWKIAGLNTAGRIGIYDLYSEKKQYPINMYYAEPNRKVLKEWKKHSVANNYQLLISLISYKTGYYKKFKKFLDKEKIKYVSFAQYLSNQNLNPEELHWRHDDHFNIKGNRLYAEFLISYLQNDISY